MKDNFEIIRKTIINMDKPFLLSDLFNKLAEQGITDKAQILGVLNDLINNGTVSQSEIKFGVWGYKSNLVCA